MIQLTVEEMYGDPGLDETAIEAALNRSLNPRRPEMLYDKMGDLGLAAHHQLLDIGSRDARHSCALAERYDWRVLAVDPVAHNLQRADKLIAERQMATLVQSQQGTIEAIPASDTSMDYIWCRDMLNHIPDLATGLVECA